MSNFHFKPLKKAEKYLERLLYSIVCLSYCADAYKVLCFLYKIDSRHYFIVWSKCARKRCKLGIQKKKLNQDIIILVFVSAIDETRRLKHLMRDAVNVL